MCNVFAPMSRTEREAFPVHYMNYLRERDGMPCLQTRTLERREVFFQRMAATPVRIEGPPRVDLAVFQRNLARCEPEPGLDAATLWALAIAKGNRTERFGVEYKLGRHGFEPAGVDDILTYVEIQECYHTRVLLHVLEVMGLTCDVGEPVGWQTRLGVKVLVELPRGMLDVAALAFEYVGIAAFHAMRAEARTLFADQPAALARIDALFGQLLVDEVGHVQFLRSRLGAYRLDLARAALRFARQTLFDDNHEIRMLLERRGDLARLTEMDIDVVVANDAERLPTFMA